MIPPSPSAKRDKRPHAPKSPTRTRSVRPCATLHHHSASSCFLLGPRAGERDAPRPGQHRHHRGVDELRGDADLHQVDQALVVRLNQLDLLEFGTKRAANSLMPIDAVRSSLVKAPLSARSQSHAPWPGVASAAAGGTFPPADRSRPHAHDPMRRSKAATAPHGPTHRSRRSWCSPQNLRV